MVDVCYSPEYVGAAHVFDTTRKAKWVADSLGRRPIKGIELVSHSSLSSEQLVQVHDPAYVRAVETGAPRSLAESQGFCWDAGLWSMVRASNTSARCDGRLGSILFYTPIPPEQHPAGHEDAPATGSTSSSGLCVSEDTAGSVPSRNIGVVPHPLALALLPNASAVVEAAEQLHRLGITREHLSVVARTPNEERELAQRMDATSGVELEQSRPAAIFGEIGGQMLAAIALVMPGIGPIVAAGPLAAELGELAGHAAGSLVSVLTSAGLPQERAEALQRELTQGSILVGVHTVQSALDDVVDCLSSAGATQVQTLTWR
jgi:hypothetical protein